MGTVGGHDVHGRLRARAQRGLLEPQVQVYGRPNAKASAPGNVGQIERSGPGRDSRQDLLGRVLADDAWNGGVADGRAALGALARGSVPVPRRAPRLRWAPRRARRRARLRSDVVTPQVLEDLRQLIRWPPSISRTTCGDGRGVRAASRRAAGGLLRHGFHRGAQPAVAELIPLPRRCAAPACSDPRFHGLWYEYIASVLPQVAPEIAQGRVIVAHLGSGASLCALKNGRSVDSSLGFTALDGLCMGTRPGALDPGVVLYLFQSLGLSAGDVEAILYKKSGLLGISGISNDMRVLLESTEPGARLAVDYFVYRAAREIGGLAAVLEDRRPGVHRRHRGELGRDPPRISDACSWLGIDLDQDANSRKGPRISRAGSRVSASVIPTNEESIIGRHTGSMPAS